MRLVIIGADGIIGRFLVSIATVRFNVLALDVKFEDPEATFWEDCEIGYLDITQYSDIEDILMPDDVVINLAAESRITNCNNDVIGSLEVNVLGSVNVMEACLKVGVLHLIQASSLYAKGSFGGFYSASKRALECYAQTYSICTSLNLSIIRLGSIFGNVDDKNSLPTKLLRRVAGLDQENLSANSRIIRDYLPASSICDAILALIDNPIYFGCEIEFLTGDKIALDVLLTEIESATGKDPRSYIEIHNEEASPKDQYLESPENKKMLHKVTIDVSDDSRDLESFFKEIYMDCVDAT